MTPSTQQTAERGRDLVAEQLSKHGARNIETVMEGRRKELRAVTPEGKRIAIRVKTKRAGTWQPRLREADPKRGEAGVDRFWIFVDLREPRPDYYIMPEPEIQADIRETHEAAIARHGGQRAHTSDSDHHAVAVGRVEGWQDRWDLLGLSPAG